MNAELHFFAPLIFLSVMVSELAHKFFIKYFHQVFTKRMLTLIIIDSLL